MPLQLRRGTEAERTAITPVVGEPLYTTDGKKLYVGDGTTAGGVPVVDLSTITGTFGTPDQIAFDQTPSTSLAVGSLQWNDGEGTLDLGLKGGNVTMPLGQKVVFQCKNSTGSPIAKGKVVYVDGAVGERPSIALANANAEATAARTIGVTGEAISNGGAGFVVVEGLITGLNTAGLTLGAAVWLDTSAGGMTTTRPTAPNHGVLVGFCLKANAGGGIVLVKVVNGQELEELHDVYVDDLTLATNHVLFWNATTSRWENGSVTLNRLGSMTAQRLVGRRNTSSGSPEEISLGTGLKLSGTVLSTDAVVSTSTSIIAGTGLTGGTQTLEANVNIGVDFAASGTTSSTKAVRADDSRLSDARTPTTHKTSHATGGADAIAPADIGAVATSRTVSAGTGLTGGGDLTANRTLSVSFGTSSTTVCVGNDSRLSDSRTPTAHKTSHATGGTDALTPSDIGAANATHTHAVGDLTQSGATTNQVITWNGTAWAPASPTGGSGSVATDTIWDQAGDLAVGSTADTAVRLARGTAGQVLTVNSGGTNIEWAAPAASSFNPATTSETWSDFLGNSTIPWQSSTANGGTVNFVQPETLNNRFGFANLGTGTTSSSARVYVGSNLQDAIEFGGGSHVFETAGVLINQLSSSTERYIVYAGFFDSLTGTPTEGAYFRYSDDVNGGDWECVTVTGSTETTTDSNVAPTTNTFYKFRIEVNAAASEVKFYIDGNLVATHNNNIPGSGDRFGVGFNVRKTVGTTLRQSRWDYLYHKAEVTR